MPHTYSCPICADKGTIGSLWWKEPCPNCKDEQKSKKPSTPTTQPPPKQCDHKCRCKDRL